MTGQDNSRPGTLLLPVFVPSVIVLIPVAAVAIAAPEPSGRFFNWIKDSIAVTFDWFYMLSVAVFVVFALYLAFSCMGRFKLGPDHADPDYSYKTWFSMLFAAGMGIGLMFFSVAEPVMHYIDPPLGQGGTLEAAGEAMKITFFHWGIHAWAIYALIGLVLAYFSFRHRLPLSIRSALYPLIGERIYGPIGHAVDIFAVLGTLFGVATSLGFGANQINAGLAYLFDIPMGAGMQIVLITIITTMATISVALGLDRGIRRLSEFNLILAAVLLLFVVIAGPTLFIFKTLVQNVGNYLNDIVHLTFNLYAYDQIEWVSDWTLFYWGWWIAWAPFVGMFIARISRGRTIREFVFGVLFVPAGFTFIWLTAFGDSALHMLRVDGLEVLAEAVAADYAVAIFQFLEALPLAAVTSLIAVTLVVIFFVTSADSSALVIVTLASGGTTHGHPLWHRIFWAVLEGVMAAALLLAGGLGALRAASIASALPFAVIMLIACWGLLRALRIELTRHETLRSYMNASLHGRLSDAWKTRLRLLIRFPGREEVRDFVAGPVRRAMEAVREELEKYGWPVTLEFDPDLPRARLEVEHEGGMNFVYEVRPRYYDMPVFANPGVADDQDQATSRYGRAEVFLREGSRGYDIFGFDEAVIASDIIDQFEKHEQFLHVSARLPDALPLD